MAQLVARLVRNEKVRGSNPLSSTNAPVEPSASSLVNGHFSFGVESVRPGKKRPKCPPGHSFGHAMSESGHSIAQFLWGSNRTSRA